MSTTDPVADRSSPLDLAGAIVRGLADRLDVEISIEPTPAAAHVLDAAEREALVDDVAGALGVELSFLEATLRPDEPR